MKKNKIVLHEMAFSYVAKCNINRLTIILYRVGPLHAFVQHDMTYVYLKDRHRCTGKI